MTAEMTDRSRWAALYVLCVGMLMIVLDATIVNVALPSIQDDLGLLAVQPRVGRERVSDRVRRPAAARRADRRPDRPAAHLPDRAGDLHRRVAAVRAVAEPGHADRRALRPGRRRRADLGRDPRHDRDDVPRAARAGQGDRRLRLRRRGRRLDRPARGRRADAGDQLALDLLRQPADRRRDRGGRAAAGRRARGDRARPGRRHSRRVPPHRRADARRVHDPRGRATRVGARRRRSASAAWRWPCSRRSCSARHAPPTP